MIDASHFDLTGKKALVTGAASGIGRTAALALAKAGADVAIVDLDDLSGEDTVRAVQKLGRQSAFVRCDVADAASVQAMVAAVAGCFGRLDIAVNNAGIYRHGDDETLSKEDWDRVIAVNLTGTWLCAQAEMRQMIRQTPVEGKLINIASIGATIACSNGAYDASKAGVVHMSRTLAARWGRYNINVNCVSPGYVVAGMGGKRRSPDERKQLRDLTPLGHAMRPADLAGPIVFLASSASSYVTGQNLIVDGGHTLSTWLSPLERNVPPRVDSEGETVDFS